MRVQQILAYIPHHDTVEMNFFPGVVMQDHKLAVAAIQREVRLRKKDITFSSKATSNTLRPRSKTGVDLSKLNHILEIGPDWVLVEPRMTFQALCKETLKQGLVPPVVPEFTTITVGGAILGAALESSSHRFGQVNDTCLGVEVVLGNGEVVRASPEENAELFYGLSGSYGTLGILTAVKLRLIEAEKYVCVTAHPQSTSALLKFLLNEHSEDFIEGIALNEKEGVALTGEMRPSPKGRLFRQNRYWSPWYIQHVAENRGNTFHMYLEEYLFRLDRGAFWMGQYILSIPTMVQLLLHIGIPKLHRGTLHPKRLFRLLFGWALGSERLYKVWHHVPKSVSENLFFVHDFYTPAPKLKEAFESFIEQTQIFPVWLCPIRGTRKPQIFAPHYGREKFVNMGLYGIPRSSVPIPELTAKLEKEITLFGGRKMLYSYTYYDRETFGQIYDLPRYETLRRTFFAEKAFPHIYNKVIIC